MHLYDRCIKCHQEDDRCDHKVTDLDKVIAGYVDKMPRFNQGNSVYRYSMFLVLMAAWLRETVDSQHGYEPIQVKEGAK